MHRVPPFRHKVNVDMKRQILQFRNELSTSKNLKPVIKLPLPEKIEDRNKKVVSFPGNKEIEDKIVEYALELDSYEVQSCARAQDYIKTFMPSLDERAIQCKSINVGNNMQVFVEKKDSLIEISEVLGAPILKSKNSYAVIGGGA